MRLRPLFIALLLLTLSGVPAWAQTLQDSEPSDVQEPPPPTDEYNNVPPGLLMAAGDLAIPSPADTALLGVDEADVMTMDDITAAYKKGDYDTVAKHLTPIANGSYPLAMEMLGIMYRNGQGVPKNPQEAVAWLTKAAEAGRPIAQHHLANMAYNGEGESADPTRAAMWLHIAISYYAAGPEQTQARQDLANIEDQLSRRDRERAYDMAREWLEKRDKGDALEPPSTKR
jgi:TPR repeat protein